MTQKVAEIQMFQVIFAEYVLLGNRATGTAFLKHNYETPGVVYRAVPSCMDDIRRRR